MEIVEFHERLKEHCKYNGDLDDCRACWFRRYCFTNKNEMTKEILDEALLRFSQPSETAISERLEDIENTYGEYVARVEMEKSRYIKLSILTTALTVALSIAFLATVAIVYSRWGRGGEEMRDCETCLHSRRIISENGFHAICCLSSVQERKCIIGDGSKYESLKDLTEKGVKK